jgi:16S rRNA (adenine1518-N6/adenine1519-N6)-dimethyltransferase
VTAYSVDSPYTPQLERVKARLFQYGASAKKSLGQHFLLDSAVLQSTVSAAGVGADDAVVEIGPGPGVLTDCLVRMAGRVMAVEQDGALVRLLRDDFAVPLAEGRLLLVEGDALRVLPEAVREFAAAYKVVANIPYRITSPLIRLLLEGTMSRPVSLTLLVQKEVARRLAAPAGTGERAYLSVLAQYYAEVSVVRSVPPQAFWPPPAVQSAVVHLAVRENRLVEAEGPQVEVRFLKFVRQLFLHPRKQLKNVLAGIRGISPEEAGRLLGDCALEGTVRAQELGPEQWLCLYRRLQE